MQRFVRFLPHPNAEASTPAATPVREENSATEAMTRGDELQNAAGKRVQGQGIRAMKEKSEKLTRVAGIPIADVCVPCYGLLQQKKASQSYVPLRDAAKCVACGERRVTGAYLAYCPGCARERRICAKCGDAHGARRTATKEQSELRALEAKLEEGDLKERERRTVLRQIERLKEKRRAEAAAQVSRHLAPCPNPEPNPDPNQVSYHLAPGSPFPDLALSLTLSLTSARQLRARRPARTRTRTRTRERRVRRTRQRLSTLRSGTVLASRSSTSWSPPPHPS